MKKRSMKILASSLCMIFTVASSGWQSALAADTTQTPITLTVMPYRVIAVKGDAAKFRALNWMNDGSSGGIKELTIEKSWKGASVEFQGHAITGDNDIGANLDIKKDNLGYLKLNYSNFQKYYETYGGFYSAFTSAAPSINKLAVDNPKLDIGNFLLELGTGDEKDLGASLSYERDVKDGIKSRLTWGTITQGVQRKIFPSYQEIDEVTDAITLKGKASVAGFDVNAKQRVEFFNGRSMREDRSPSAATPIVRQLSAPIAKQSVSSLMADKWILNDKTYVATGYQFQYLRNSEFQNIGNYSSLGVIASSTGNRNKYALNRLDSHTWVQHVIIKAADNFSIIGKMKEEIIDHHGDADSWGIAPGGTSTFMRSEDKTTRIGESLSLRYTGIAKTSLYADAELQQGRNWLSQTYSSSYREDMNINRLGQIAVGMRVTPTSKVTLSSQVKHRSDRNNYNVFYSDDQGISIARLQNNSNEFDNRISYKPFKWLDNSFRVQLVDNIFHVQNLDQAGWTTTTEWQKTQGTSRIYTYNIVLQPLDPLMFDLGYSLNNLKVSTPASNKAVASGGLPTSTANYYTWIFTTSFAPTEKISLYNTFEYTRSKNFNGDMLSAGIPYGLSNEHYDVIFGMKFSPKKDVSIEPHYGYYSYRANQSMDYGNYSAHVFWLDTTVKW